jgi:hypothetical protein
MKKIILATIVIIIGGSLGGSLWWWQQKTSGNNNQKLAKQGVSKDWQDYTNTKYGFSFIHPKDVGYLSPENNSFLGSLSDKEAAETNILILGKKLATNNGENEYILNINTDLENKDAQIEEFSDNETDCDKYFGLKAADLSNMLK